MINLNINLAIKADQMPDVNAAYVAAFIKALAREGYQFSTDSIRSVKAPAIAREKGPNETLVLEQTGKKWLKVPGHWNGTREEYFGKVLTGETIRENDDTETEESVSSDPMDIFHE